MHARPLLSVFFAIQRAYWFSFTQTRSCLISLKTAVTKAPCANAVGIELLPLMDEHTREDTFGFIQLTIRHVIHLSGENFTCIKLCFLHVVTAIRSLKWICMLEGVECSPPLKDHVILQLNLKHKRGFHMTTAKCKRALKWNSWEFVLLIMCVCFT